MKAKLQLYKSYKGYKSYNKSYKSNKVTKVATSDNLKLPWTTFFGLWLIFSTLVFVTFAKMSITSNLIGGHYLKISFWKFNLITNKHKHKRAVNAVGHKVAFT